MNVDGQGDEFLPIDNPVAGKNQKKQHELGIDEHFSEIAKRFGKAGSLFFVGALRLLEKKEHGEKHEEDADGRNAEDVFDAHVFVHPGGYKRTESAADVHQGVVDRIADGTDIFPGGPGGGAHDAGLDQGDAEGGKHEHDGHQGDQRNRIANGSEPGRPQGTQEKIGPREEHISERKSAAEAQPVGDGAAENGEEPNQAAEQTGKIGGAFGGEIQRFVKVAGQRSEGRIVGEALEELAEVGDPEGTLEAVADFLEPLAKSHVRGGCIAVHAPPPDARRDDTRGWQAAAKNTRGERVFVGTDSRRLTYFRRLRARIGRR